MAKKVGPNVMDERYIAQWAAAGKSAAEISDLLQIEVAAVERNMPRTEPAPEPAPEPTPTPSTEVAKEANDVEHTEQHTDTSGGEQAQKRRRRSTAGDTGG